MHALEIVTYILIIFMRMCINVLMYELLRNIIIIAAAAVSRE